MWVSDLHFHHRNLMSVVMVSSLVLSTATSFKGDGSQLTGIDASALSFGGSVKVQANASGAVVTGIITGDGSGLTGLPSGSELILEQLALQPQKILVLIQRLLIIMKQLVLQIHLEVSILVMGHLSLMQD